MKSLGWLFGSMLPLGLAALCFLKFENILAGVLCSAVFAATFLIGAILNHREHLRR